MPGSMVFSQSPLTNSTAMLTLKQLVLSFTWLGTAVAQETLSFGPSTFTAPGAFPTSAYSHYFNSPTATSAQVQPVISDPVLVRCFVVCIKHVGKLTIKYHSTKSMLLP